MLDSVYEVRCARDMEEVEKRITQLLHGEKGRCGILRSAAYQQFRLGVLYRNRQTVGDVMQVGFSEERIKLVFDGQQSVALFCATVDVSEFEGDEEDTKTRGCKRKSLN
jgi:hypothetical protein